MVFFGAGYRGIEQFPTQQTMMIGVRKDSGDRMKFAALTFVNGHGETGLMLW